MTIMFKAREKSRSADTAKLRLGNDKQLRPVVQMRVELEILSKRFEESGRHAMVLLLAEQVKTDMRLMPWLQKMLRIPRSR